MSLGDIVDELHDDDGFPTPAPPKAPTLPPLVKGQMRSITLIPVSRMFALVSCSTSEGAGRWIGYFFVNSTGPRWSVGSPTTLKIRPRTLSPTGTEIGSDVLTTSIPPLKSLGRAHRDGADPVLTKVLLNFEGEFDGTLCSFETNLKRVEYLWEFPILWVELDIHNWTDDLDDFSCVTHDF